MFIYLFILYISYIYIYIYVYAIMKTMCPPGYHHNGFVLATHALGHMMYGYILMVPKSAQQAKQGTLVLRSLLCFWSILWFTGTSNV